MWELGNVTREVGNVKWNVRRETNGRGVYTTHNKYEKGQGKEIRNCSNIKRSLDLLKVDKEKKLIKMSNIWKIPNSCAFSHPSLYLCTIQSEHSRRYIFS